MGKNKLVLRLDRARSIPIYKNVLITSLITCGGIFVETFHQA